MSWDLAMVHHIERRLQVELGMGLVEPDEDGDYACLADEGPVVWVRPALAMDPPTLRVFCQAAREVKRSAALLTELNSWNNALPIVRVSWESGVVRAFGDLTIMSIEPGELGALVRQVSRTAQQLSEVVCPMFGGTSGWPRSEHEPSGGAVDL